MNALSHIICRNEDQSLMAAIPKKQILNQSLLVVAPHKRFNDWSAQNHADSYLFMQRIAQTWKESNFTNQYLIYGTIGSNPFNWEMIPYQKCHHFIGRAVQQLFVLWRTVFGGVAISEQSSKDQTQRYQLLLNKSPEILEPSSVSCKNNDAFCKEDTIERQWVITGNKVNVLFNYAPIGFGGERLHFLIVPKAHRETFTDVTREEYCESIELTTKLVNHFEKTRKNIKNAYILNKTGVDAGQTVNHWHLHVILTTNPAQDFWGKMTVVKNILLGSSPMKKSELAKKVGALRNELAPLKT